MSRGCLAQGIISGIIFYRPRSSKWAESIQFSAVSFTPRSGRLHCGTCVRVMRGGVTLEVAWYGWARGGAMRGLSVSHAWGASAEEIPMECGAGALVAVHPCGRQGVVTCTRMHRRYIQRRCKFQRGAQRRVIPMSALERLGRARAARERAVVRTTGKCKLIGHGGYSADASPV